MRMSCSTTEQSERCNDVADGDRVVFTVTLTLEECKAEGDIIVSVGVGGHRDVVAVYITPQCTCACESLDNIVCPYLILKPFKHFTYRSATRSSAVRTVISSAACVVATAPIKVKSASAMARVAQRMMRVVAGAILALRHANNELFSTKERR